MRVLFTLTIFVSASLLFLVQPLFTKMVLPLLGGSPAVWNTAVLFFQGVLLLGYIYAHVATARLGVRRQAVLHSVLLLLPLLVLPLALPAGWQPPVDSNPIPWLLALLCVSVGLPFFVISASSPMLQIWFAHTDDPAADDPYFLYAASNAGSMLALLGYPFFMEPSMRLVEQSWSWSIGYGLLVLLTITCAVALRRVARQTGDSAAGRGGGATGRDGRATELTVGRRLRWILLAFVPSSLMLSVTTYLSTDISPFPLLWVIPLAIYLLSFILVFASRPPIPLAWMVRLLPFVLLPLAVMILMQVRQYFWLQVPLHLFTLFVVSMVCHGRLAEDRPPTRHLTEFFLWLAVGGTLGGLFNALLAPLLFTSVVEYPLGLVLACMMLPSRDRDSSKRARWLDVGVPALLGGVLYLMGLILPTLDTGYNLVIQASVLILPLVVVIGERRRPLRSGLTLGVMFLIFTFLRGEDSSQLLNASRSFFGINRVSAEAEFHVLAHGRTVHGLQSRIPEHRLLPLSYYYPTGPLGQLFESLDHEAPRRSVAVVGLGAGSIGCYKQPGQQWTFYEIDPDVARIAQDPHYFTLLRDCTPEAEIILGDARLALVAAPSDAYDLLILDAYSSDSIPVHLITREALGLYLEKLAPDGILAFHITNHYLDLEPVLGNLAEHLGLVALIQHDRALSPEEEELGKARSTWVVMARDRAALGEIGEDSRWQPLKRVPEIGIWTDDFSSILSVLKWRDDFAILLSALNGR